MAPKKWNPPMTPESRRMVMDIAEDVRTLEETVLNDRTAGMHDGHPFVEIDTIVTIGMTIFKRIDIDAYWNDPERAEEWAQMTADWDAHGHGLPFDVRAVMFVGYVKNVLELQDYESFRKFHTISGMVLYFWNANGLPKFTHVAGNTEETIRDQRDGLQLSLIELLMTPREMPDGEESSDGEEERRCAMG